MSLRRISRIPLNIRNFSSSVDRNSIHPTASNLENKIPKTEELQKKSLSNETKSNNNKSEDQYFKPYSSLIIGGVGIALLVYCTTELKNKNSTIISNSAQITTMQHQIWKLEKECEKKESEKSQTEILNNFLGGIAIGAFFYKLLFSK